MKKLILTILVLSFSLPLQAATLKIATVTPEGSQWMTEMRASAKEIKERTEGRVQIKYYGGGVMGNDQKVLSRIRIGALQGGAFTPTALSSQYPDLNLYGLPMVFDSEEEAAYVREQMDAKLRQGLEDAGWVNFGFAAGGFAILMSNTPVTSLADLKGKKVWVPDGDTISRASMEAMSLSPVNLPLTDVLTGLQTGLIDIVGMSPIGALVLQWHTKVKYVVELPLVYTLGFMAIDKRAFYKLDPADQAIVREVMERTYRNFDKSNLVDNQGALEALLNSGIESTPFNLDEYQKVRELTRVSTEKLGRDGAFTMALYEEMMQHAADYRNGQTTAAN
ncbi:MAG: TRAP transporter substrate-binding protein DctP [Gammaproteobacteria bacterium]|nr:TRAP transporter substrate-binding protein DctP [Gammaproteobacteria bacterium]MDH5618926.1 TRAP transporter substrate-binding protein DctP [Gammaproteobacteria bacterium]